MEQVTGVEPAWPGWKPGTLPLSYTCETVRAVIIPSLRRPSGRVAAVGARDGSRGAGSDPAWCGYGESNPDLDLGKVAYWPLYYTHMSAA